MDPVSHAIVGRFVVTAGSRTRPRGAVAAAGILGALSPDVDFVLMPVGWDIYLRAHEIGTHSLAGAVLTGLAAAGVVRGLARGSRYGALAVASAAGAVSHLIGDVVSGARLRPGWPIVDVTTGVPLVAMADPWPIAIVAIGRLLFWRYPMRSVSIARRTLIVLVAFLALKALLLGMALSRTDADGGWRSAADRIVEARWGSLTAWDVFGRTGDSLTHWTVDVGGGAPTTVFRVPRGEESALVRASRSLDTVRNFLHVHELVFAEERALEDGRHAVLWSDIQFCRPDSESAGRVSCALWFGGVFGPDGATIEQQVRVGDWLQRRPFRGGAAAPHDDSP